MGDVRRGVEDIVTGTAKYQSFVAKMYKYSIVGSLRMTIKKSNRCLELGTMTQIFLYDPLLDFHLTNVRNRSDDDDDRKFLNSHSLNFPIDSREFFQFYVEQ